MRTLTIAGDICIARGIPKIKKELLSPSVKENFKDTYVIGNLESPFASNVSDDHDHLQFLGDPKCLEKIGEINTFSLANNHINDFDISGIKHTMDILSQRKIDFCGINKIYHKNIENSNIVILMVADMMNIPIKDKKYEPLYLFDDKCLQNIKELKRLGKSVFVYCHTSLLFIRLPSMKTRLRLHELIDAGAEKIITAHGHCMGGMEKYKSSKIYYNLGDFIMDGNSFSRRKSYYIQFDFAKKIESIRYTNFINDQVKYSEGIRLLIQKLNYRFISGCLLVPIKLYPLIFFIISKIDLFNHILSTICFLINRRGFKGFYILLRKRRVEAFRFIKWILRSNLKISTNMDAIKKDRKKFTNKDYFDEN